MKTIEIHVTPASYIESLALIGMVWDLGKRDIIPISFTNPLEAISEVKILSTSGRI